MTKRLSNVLLVMLSLGCVSPGRDTSVCDTSACGDPPAPLHLVLATITTGGATITNDMIQQIIAYRDASTAWVGCVTGSTR